MLSLSGHEIINTSRPAIYRYQHGQNTSCKAAGVFNTFKKAVRGGFLNAAAE